MGMSCRKTRGRILVERRYNRVGRLFVYYSQPYNSEPPYPSWSWSTVDRMDSSSRKSRREKIIGMKKRKSGQQVMLTRTKALSELDYSRYRCKP
jgi:hypothetical protein